MRIKILPGALVIAALVTLAISLGVATPNVYGGGDDSLPTLPEKPELKYPNLGSNLDQLVASVEKDKTSAKEAAEDAPVHREASVAVTIYLSGNLADVVKFLEDNGGSPRNVDEDYIETYVPVSLLGRVSEQPGVIRVREIAPAEPAQIAQQVAGHGPPVHGSSAWNQAGFSGQGIKVGVIDLRFGFNGFSGLMGTELPSTVQARCYTSLGKFTRFLASCENSIVGSNHGTLVAEAVIDIAPEVSLYIATPRSLGDLQTATDWMVSQGVSVIVHSVVHEYDGPGDGTSPFSNSPLKTVDRAVAGGSVWVNGAGNYGRRSWFGAYSIVTSGSSRFLTFNGSDIFNDMTLEAGDDIRVQLRWEDSWGGATSDFDLYVYDRTTRVIVASSFDPQRGVARHVPYESVTYLASRDGRYAVVVNHEGGSTPEWIQLTVGGVDSIEYHTESGSIANPAESRNAGMLAVGAAHWNSVGSIEPYSSRGPTPDGRVKPDIVGADCGATALRPLNEYRNGFCGTSQATPHVAGMAALVRQRFPTYTPVQVANYLKEHAEQRESPDPNNTWGHGFAKLPSLSECSDAVHSVASNPGLVADCEALLAARDTLAGSRTLNWSGSTAIAAWDGVTLSGSPLRVTSLVLSDSQLTGTIPPELGNLNNLERLNLTRNQLTGDIPPELSLLTNLQLLALGGNQSTGPIPTWLGSLAKLQELQLWGNQFTGAIPPELGNLPGLVKLGLSENQLSGPVPTWMGSLADLEELYLSQNQLSGAIPSELGSLTNLEILALGGNQLSGQIPSQLASLTNLQRLSLYDNQLSGPVPTWLGRLVNLQELYLSQNQLTGVIPTELESLVNLQELYLSQNQLTGVIPTELESLVNLEQLVLWGNHLTGVISPGLSNLTNLEVLSLSNNQLTGVIPTELGILTNLEILALGGNQLSGPVPTWMGSLADLQELYLSQNQLSGAIPTELGSLSKLQVLYLWGNQLTGEIPAGLGSLTNLERLWLSGNQLTGEIPAELGSLTNLKDLRLGGNQLTGEIPAGLGSLTNLRVLWLAGNQLTGCIPGGLRDVPLNDLTQLGLDYCMPATTAGDAATDRAALAALYNATDGANWANNDNWLSDKPLGEWHGVTTDSDGRVRRLDLSDNQLSGEIPSELGSLSNLEWLWLQRNQLSGVPPELGSLSNLERLHLSGNQLTQIPGELGKLSRLERLDLSDNQLSGVPPELGSLSNLTHLYLHDNQLSGEIPAELGSLSNLEWLWLQRNQLSGEIPAELGSLSNLERLDLSDNQLSGVPPELGSLSNLERLDLSDNQLSGVPPELGSLSNLTHLYLHDNQLSGEIPSELGSLSNLEWLWLQRNQLSGEIPAELGSLSNLERLDLSDNQLSGVPPELGSLSNLERLDLSDNQLSGVPPELGSLSNLTHLYLHDNQLSGEIPSELGSLSNLEWLWLQRNQLSGEIPAELGSLSNLERLDLSDNQLSGPIPASLGGLANLERLSLSQNMLTGCVPEAWRDIAESDVLELGLPFCAVSLGTAPVFSDSEGNPITEAVRSVVENTSAGENVGAPVTAMDADNDTLTYSLGGTDMASFDIDPPTGQIMVGTGTMLDYETKASYMVTVTATDPDSASDMITVTITVTNEEETGEVTLWAGMDALTMAPQVSDTITGAVMDPDGGVMGESWQWSRTMDAADMNSWMPISGATDAAYMVTEGDTGYHLRVMATYTDAVGTDMAMVYSMPTMMVGAEAGDTLLDRYDANNNGQIDRPEVLDAIRDFVFNQTIERDDVVDVIRLFVFRR